MRISRCFYPILALAALLWTLAGCGGPDGGDVPADGSYQVEVALEGGSGRAGVQSPAELSVSGGEMTVTLVWSSSSYDYMVVDEVRYDPVSLEPGATYQIPVTALGRPFAVIADTTAMSAPHEITYTLTVYAPGETAPDKDEPDRSEEPSQSGDVGQAVSRTLTYDHSMPLSYAEGFSVDYYREGYALLSIFGDNSRFLLIPEGMEAPADLAETVTPLRLPLKQVYLTATAVMDMFISLDAMDVLGFTGTKENGWYLKEARTAMAEGRLAYAGNYAAPDYERIYAAGCGLAIENTMIYHAPEVKEQLERFGIPVLVDRSSYELSPLGRMEWIKVYGLLSGREEAANAAFDRQAAAFAAVSEEESTGKTVAFFYITSTGEVNVRRSSDYIPKMIEMAGGRYLPENLGDKGGSAASTLSMQMEAFYAAARDADFIVYNSAIDGELASVDQLLDKGALLKNLKAVREGNVFCTTENLYQSSMELGTLTLDLRRMLSGERDNMTFLYHVE